VSVTTNGLRAVKHYVIGFRGAPLLPYAKRRTSMLVQPCFQGTQRAKPCPFLWGRCPARIAGWV